MNAPPARAAARLPRSDRRAQLIGAAKLVFVARGYHATGMDEIADRAGVSKPVLYQHFPSKLELYLALLAGSAAEMVRLVRAALTGTEHNDERVHRAVQAYFTYVADSNETYRLIFESDLRATPEVAAIVDRATQDCIDAITATITTDTGADPARAQLLASGLVGLSQVSARYWISGPGDLSRDEAIELLSTLAWRGISRFPRHPHPDESRTPTEPGGD